MQENFGLTFRTLLARLHKNTSRSKLSTHSIFSTAGSFGQAPPNYTICLDIEEKKFSEPLPLKPGILV